MKVYITLLIVTLFITIKAQTNPSINKCELQPINIGDKIPDQVWNRDFAIINHTRRKEFLKLSEYGNKLIILDFWATYCKPCIKSLDYLDSIQHEFKDDLVVIPVLVYDKIDNAPAFMKKKGYKWPCIVGDTTIDKNMIDRYKVGYGTLWIKEGKLLAIPSKKSLTTDNIRSIINGQKVKFISRKLSPKVI